MTFVITRGCCKDASCVPVCPVNCIRPTPEDPDFATAEQLYVDPAACIDCGACMDECPVDAVHSEWDLAEDMGDFVGINASYFTAGVAAAPAPARSPAPRRLPTGHAALSVAVIGSGPAGCYAAAELSEIKGVTVSVFDRLPTPFGLVRAGVAPDHPDTKRITRRFTATLARPGVHCFFNVSVGQDITIAELLEHHHAVLWAGGATGDRKLGIPGEGLPGCYSAREFVAWYNGHPEFTDRRFDLQGHRAVVIGNGNVALDIARVLARPASGFRQTDMADHAIEALEHSAITDVVVAARRGPEHAAYTTGELLALERTEGVTLLAAATEVSLGPDDASHRDAIIAAAARRSPRDGERTITFRYGLMPVSVNGDGRAESVTFRRADGTAETIDASLVIRAAGYHGEEVPGLPYDQASGTLPHRAGAVYDPATGLPVPGIYCAGWIKRGATGVIGSNRIDARESVGTILADLRYARLADPRYDIEHLTDLVRSRQPEVVTAPDWARIDEAERRQGDTAGRPRVKFVHLSDLLNSARA